MVFIRGSGKSGVPMLCNEGSFGTICDNGWDENDAKVICRMLGYPTEGKLLVCNTLPCLIIL